MSGRDESSTARDFRWPGITWGEPKAESVSAAVAQAASLVLVSFAYYLAILASIRLRLGYSSLSVIWPSNAILLAVLVLAPKRRWWQYLLAVVPAHVLALKGLHFGAWWLAYQIAHNSILAIVAASILQKYKPGLMRFDRLRPVLAFLAVSIVIPAVVSCGLILPFLALANKDVLLQHGWVGGFWTIWSGRWLTNTVSILVFVPVTLVWLTNGLAWFRDVSPRRYIEACVLAVMLVAVSLAVFGGTHANAYLYPALFLVPLPLLLWASVRFGSTGASTSIAAVVCISVWCAYRGEGPFVDPASIDIAISLQMFWILLAVPLLPLAALIQEHKAARMALVESEDQFRHLFEQASIGVALESLEGRLTLVNPAFCSILGYTERELLQMSCVSISHPEDATTEKPLFQELMSGQRPSYQLEKRFFRKDGTQMWGHVSVSLLKGRNGMTPLVIGMLRDVTARKTAESQLRASEARLQSTLDLLPASILIVDEAGKIIEVNARCRELAGTEEPRYPSFRAGANLFEVCEATVGENSELARAVAEGVRRLLAGEAQADPPLQLCRSARGLETWYQICMARFYENEAPRVVLSYRDVSDVIRAREELAQNKEQLSMALEASHSGTWDWDIAAGRMHCSDDQLLGLGMEKMELDRGYLQFLRLIRPDDRELVKQAVVRALHAGDTFSCQFRVINQKTGIRWILAKGKLIRDAQGRAFRMLGVHVDITDLKERDRELEKLTGRLIQAQEDERHRISRELHDDIGQQASVLVNDLDALGRELSAADQTTVSIQAQTLRQQASELASDIHELSHELHSSRLQHLGLVSALKELAGKISAQRPLTINLQADDLPNHMPQDVALCLYRVAQEALSNVTKHSAARTVLLEFKRIHAMARLCIKDDGTGFDPSMQSSGIGFTSMRERLRMVGGELLVKSSPGEGTEVTAQVCIAQSKASAARA